MNHLPRPALLEKGALPRLVEALQEDYDVVAPVVGEGAIQLSLISSSEELALGYVDRQSPGHYRLERAADGRLFSYVNGADSPKKYLFPAHQVLFTGEIRPDGFTMVEEPGPPRPLAFFGMRPCDRQAVRVLDKTFLSQPPDAFYRKRREGAFFLVANCGRLGELCFCESMGSGPRARTGFDLALTELSGDFLLEPGSDRGQAILQRLPVRAPTTAALMAAEAACDEAMRGIHKTLNTVNLPAILRSELDHPYWDFMDDWCVGCGNCTAVCPTCFCNSIFDRMDVSRQRVERVRVWDVCFTQQFAEVHGGNFRPDLRARYRHWCLHKLSYWLEQYAVFGCVGCGRCITWCPVRIDIAEVATVIRGER